MWERKRNATRKKRTGQTFAARHIERERKREKDVYAFMAFFYIGHLKRWRDCVRCYCCDCCEGFCLFFFLLSIQFVSVTFGCFSTFLRLSRFSLYHAEIHSLCQTGCSQSNRFNADQPINGPHTRRTLLFCPFVFCLVFFFLLSRALFCCFFRHFLIYLLLGDCFVAFTYLHNALVRGLVVSAWQNSMKIICVI